MRLFSKRKSIKKQSKCVAPFFCKPLHKSFLFKLISLSILLGSIFYFRFWAERQRESIYVPPSSSFQITGNRADKAPSEPGDRLRDSSADPIDVNAAPLQELQSLPGVGPLLAREIVQSRLDNGPFRQASDLLRVKGIGPKKLRRMESRLRFKEVDE